MRKISIFILTGIMLSFSAPSFSGIPVVDAISNSQEMAHWLEKVKQWEETVVHYDRELNAYKNQLATATGVRDVQLFLRQAKNLTNDIKAYQKRGISLNDLLTTSSYTSELNNLYDKYKSFDICGSNAKDSYLDSCKQMVINQAVAIEETTEIQENLASTLSDISDLSDRISYSTDSKESQDLANVVTAKSVQLNALTSQWEMSVKQSELRNSMIESKRQKEFQEQQRSAPVADFNSIGY
ncbi:type IV secretion system protein VirB5 [Salmonella enterica subsp. enterica serovar Wilhelmsburg]|nr:type IV secretion system protein VirB5 [Salmonella enterica subsp. enterica serovar Wilhelmsburg]